MIINNEYVRKWVEELARLCRPDAIYWCNGSEEEYERLSQMAVEDGSIKPLNKEAWPNCFAYSNYYDDCETQHERTFVCTERPEDGADTSQWMKPSDMLGKLETIMANAMEGKIMYVLPYVMGPVGSPFSQMAVEITDSVYVVLNMSIIARVGDVAWRQIGDRGDFYRGVHVTGNLDARERYIAHFPDDRMVYTINTEYGGYSFQSKSSMAMVLASATAAKEGWLAEHMMILGIENPKGEVRYIAGAFPTSCGKTNLALMIPPEYAKGYKCHTIGDDIAWLRPGPDGRLWAINPECGFFSVLPGVNKKSNPLAMTMIRHNSFFTNVAISEDGLPWWEGKDSNPPDNLRDWQGNPWTPDSSLKASHPNARFTTHASQLPSMSKHWDSMTGVPLSAIIFGGRSTKLDPLIREAFDWRHGVFMGAGLFAERLHRLERNPMGILPFLGCSMEAYLNNWLAMEEKLDDPPKIFRVNWFRQDEGGNYIWPGYSENFRVLEWILARCHDETGAGETPIGLIPEAGSIKTEGLPLNQAELMGDLLSVNKEAWLQESRDLKVFFDSFRNLPPELYRQLQAQQERLG